MSYLRFAVVVFVSFFILCWWGDENMTYGQPTPDQGFSIVRLRHDYLCPMQYSTDGVNIFRWTLEKNFSDNPRETEQYTWVISRVCMNDQKKKTYIIPSEADERTLKRREINFYPVNDAILMVAPDGKYFILRFFNGKSILVCSETEKKVVLSKDTASGFHEGEIPLGFSDAGDLFCGTQCLNPLLLLRDTQSLMQKEVFYFRKMNYPPHVPLDPGYWLNDDVSQDNIGILYSVLPPPEDNPNSGLTVLPFTTFQFRFMMAMVVVYDSNDGFDCTQTLVDATRWFQREKVFIWSLDGKYLAVHDGPQKLQIYDREKRCFSDVCNIYGLSNESFLYIRKAWFLPSGEIALVIGRNPGRENRDIKTVIWSPQTREFSEPFFTPTILSVSPKGDFIATGTMKNQPSINFRRSPYVEMAETIDFWCTKEEKKIHSLQLKSLSNVYFAPNWSLLECERLDENNEIVSEVIDLSKILSLQNDNAEPQESDPPIAPSESVEEAKNAELSDQNDYRTWTSANGSFQTEAKYLTSTETQVTIERKDGSQLAVDLERLSSSEREYVKQRQ